MMDTHSKGAIIRAELGTHELRCLVLFSVLALTIAYQFFPAFRLTVGDWGDEVFESGMYFREGTPSEPFRWTGALATLNLPGIGNQPLRVSLHLNGLHPKTSPYVRITANEQNVAAWQTGGAWDVYSFVLDRQTVTAWGNVQIQIASETFSNLPDPRKLGVMFAWVQVESLPGLNPVLPPPVQFSYFVALIAVVYIGARLAGSSKRRAWFLALGALLLLTLGIGFARIPLSIYAWLLPPVALSLYLLARFIVRSNRWQIIALGVLLVSFTHYLQGARAVWELGAQADFQTYFEAAERLYKTGILYDFKQIAVDPIGGVYKYPPLWGLVLAQMTPLGLETVYRIWFVINQVVFLLTLLLLASTISAPARTLKVFGLWIAAFNFQPILDTLNYGQMEIVVLFLIVLAWIGFRYRRETAVGAVIAVAASLKIYPAILLVPFLLGRRWRVLIAFTLSGIVLGIVFSMALGFDPIFRYATQVLPGQSVAVPSPENQSLNGFVSRLFASGHGLQTAVALPFPDWARGLLLILVGFCVLLTLAYLVRARRLQEKNIGFVIAALMPLTILILPTSWMHYATLCLLSFAVLLDTLPIKKKQDWVLLAGWVASYLVLAFGDEFTVAGDEFCCGAAMLLRSFRLYGVVLLWALCLVGLTRAGKIAPAE